MIASSRPGRLRGPAAAADNGHSGVDIRIYRYLARALPGLSFAQTVTLALLIVVSVPLIAIIIVAVVVTDPSVAMFVVVTVAASVVSALAGGLLIQGLLSPIQTADRNLNTYLSEGRVPRPTEATKDEVGRLLRNISLACTRLEQQRVRNEKHAGFDSLTGLNNRRASEDHLSGVFPSYADRRRPLTIALIDLDHLRTLNETQGLAVGDAELQRVALTIEKTLRADDWIGRWDEDEFLVACHANAEVMEHLMHRLRHTLADPPAARQGVTVSVGIAELDDEEPIDDCLVRAENALARAKSNGRNRLHIG